MFLKKKCVEVVCCKWIWEEIWNAFAQLVFQKAPGVEMFNHPPFIMHQKKLELVWRFVISGSCSKVHVFGCEQTMRTASRHRHDPLKQLSSHLEYPQIPIPTN